MSKLQVFAGKKTGKKRNVVDSIGFAGSTKPYIKTDGFTPSEYGVFVGAVVTNVSTGVSTTIELIVSDMFIVLDTNICNVGDIYETVVYEKLSETVYTELDLFDDETVEITQNIKDFKDISKILADYTQSFKVPASKTNNRYFEHYYNEKVADGFDARFRYECILKLNGVDWKEGQIRLTDVGMKNGSADNYQISFFGNIVSLKAILGDDTLDSLPYLDVFDHPLSLIEVRDLFSLGANLTYDSDGKPTGYVMNTYPAGYIGSLSRELGDLIYTFISAENRYYVDTSDSQPTIDKNRNLYTPSNKQDEFHGLLYTDLKPSIKIIHFIKAIESKYGIKFSEDFISENNLFFKTVYMQCGAESGSLLKKAEEKKAEFKLQDLNFSSGDEVREGSGLDYITILPWERSGGRKNYTNINLSGIVSVSGSSSYKFKIVDDYTNEVYFEDDINSGNYGFDVDISYSIYKLIRPKIVITTLSGLSSVSINSFYIENKRDNFSIPDVIKTGVYTTISQSPSSNLGFRKDFVPKMKCIDFLKSLFKMTNCIGYVENNEIVIKPLNDYYDEGETFDVTEYVDNSSYKVSRSDVFSEINYKFKDPKTVFRIKSDELSEDEYGNESFSSDETTSFDGGKYDVKVDFGKMVYERFLDVANNQYTGSRWGYSVNESYSPTVEPNLLHSVKMGTFWANNKSNGQANYKYKLTDGNSYIDLNPYQQIFHSPRNFFEGIIDESTFSLNFGDEAYNNTSINKNSLFKKYHEEYIIGLYSPLARRVTIDAYLPFNLVIKIKTNSILIINNKSYIINSIKNNLTTGKTKLELLSQ